MIVCDVYYVSYVSFDLGNMETLFLYNVEWNGVWVWLKHAYRCIDIFKCLLYGLDLYFIKILCLVEFMYVFSYFHEYYSIKSRISMATILTIEEYNLSLYEYTIVSTFIHLLVEVWKESWNLLTALDSPTSRDHPDMKS